MADAPDETGSKKGCGPDVAVIGCGPAGMFFLHAVSERRRMMEEAGDADGLRRLPAAVVCYEKSTRPGGVWKAERGGDEVDVTHCTDIVSTGSESTDPSNVEAGMPIIDEAFMRSLDEEDSCSSSSSGSSSDSSSDKSSVSSCKSTAYPSKCTGTELNANVQTIGNMYEALWTNGPKERIEFVDYTYEDHFGKGVSLPTYMPRQPMLEYMVARCTRNNPTLFDDVRFETTVTSVTYDERVSKFIIKSYNSETGADETATYDKCIWAAGDNGRPRIPVDIDETLNQGGYVGRTIHSSLVGAIDFDRAVRGKNILMIGDGFSTEDLTLQAIKLGAERVYIVSRHSEGVCNYVSSWPGDKVKILEGMKSTAVINKGRGIRFQEMKLDFEDDWQFKPVAGGKVLDVEDVSLVVYCTGYSSNLKMLDAPLQKPFHQEEVHFMPEGWKMKHNELMEDLGHVEPSDGIYATASVGSTVYFGMYRNLLMSNPNMMLITQFGSAPLFEIDVYAWLCLGYITGDVEIPSYEEMARRNIEQLHAEMDVHNLRCNMDEQYYQAVYELEIGQSDHFLNDYQDPRVLSFDKEEEHFHLRCIARDARNGGYPDDIGGFDELNEKGKELLKVHIASEMHRLALPKKGAAGAEWMTFRDGDTSGLASIHTGLKAAPLRKPWLELSDEEYDDLLSQGLPASKRELR